MAKKAMTFKLDEYNLDSLIKRVQDHGLDLNKTQTVEFAMEALKMLLFCSDEDSVYVTDQLKENAKVILRMAKFG